MTALPRTLALTAALGLAALPLAAPAMAADATDLSGNLTQLNDSGVTAEVTGSIDGTELRINITPNGLLADAPHAQHIHIGGTNSCPSNDEEGSGADGALQVSDAADRYGAIAVSLTTEGDTSPDSGLAVDRFPVGDASYSRTIEVSQEVADQIADGDGVVVLHGVDQNGSGTYDGDTPSDLDPSLPEEATNPAACGTLDVAQMSMPGGGVDTGAGGVAGSGSTTTFVVGGAALAAAGAAGVVLLRRRGAQD
ncbi:hypothetical protein [Pseudokineococcus lusitanus]|uniref:CHRD domain-containing protein n=1 Tax=Pseudokineococcus lusitanus TaxID=763993 RepID=A0A3N1G8K2_9ACTN|nr:hypothetical protein [Pseudokineococcus lusitanus]ROP26537.1 hypothetical protein EDC03_3387 [Pseudokineococcus lusitanus]